MELTFKQYLESKDNLREAVKNTPKQKRDYRIKKYCKLPVGESKDSKQILSLKPKQVLTVEWSYEDFDSPEPLMVIQEDQQMKPFWNQTKFQDWLRNNATEIPM